MAANLKRLRAELEQLGDQHKAWKKQVPTLQDLIRRAYAAGIIQAEIADMSGYERDNIRLLCMDPEQREAIRARRRKNTDQAAVAAPRAVRRADRTVSEADPELVAQLEQAMADKEAVRRRGGRPKREPG